MLLRVGLFMALAVASLMTVASAGAQTPEKFATLEPTSGPVGTVVHAELFNAPPGDAITVIFKIPGDPILATGTADAQGHAEFTFTIPYVPGGGVQTVFFTNFKCSCQVSALFTITQGVATPIPTATPTQPPATATPQTPATPTPTSIIPATPTATPTNTPVVPVLGNGSIGGGGPNVGILALGFMAVVTVLAWFAATRRGPGSPSLSVARIADDGPDYSTELDLASLEALRRPFRGELKQDRRGGLGWAIGAGVSAVAGVLLLRRK
jgi:hypothetical protein